MNKYIYVLSMVVLIIGGSQTVYADQSQHDKLIELLEERYFRDQKYSSVTSQVNTILLMMLQEMIRHNKEMEKKENKQ